MFVGRQPVGWFNALVPHDDDGAQRMRLPAARTARRRASCIFCDDTRYPIRIQTGKRVRFSLRRIGKASFEKTADAVVLAAHGASWW